MPTGKTPDLQRRASRMRNRSRSPDERGSHVDAGDYEDGLNDVLRVAFHAGVRRARGSSQERGRQLLCALSSNAIAANTNPHLTIRTVLGPRYDADTERLESLLAWALHERGRRVNGLVSENFHSRYEILREPLWAEDFMALFSTNATGLETMTRAPTKRQLEKAIPAGQKSTEYHQTNHED